MTDALIDWFLREKRSLPFRDSGDAYRIWVSEVMAQQTRMAALIPYYERFVTRFPDVWALAQAEESDVLTLWAGLGYYTRARSLHKAARIVCERYGGALPPDAALLRALPGFGDYTAGAVASIAYGLPVPAVDGNVRRVYARLLASESGNVAAWVRSLMDNAPPRLVTESLMELGALVCLPGTPHCAVCPIAPHCRAFAEERISDFPPKREKPTKREEQRTLILARDAQGRVLLRRRTERLLHNLWEFPEQAQLMADGFAVTPNPVALGQARHVFTHLIWHMSAHAAEVTHENPPENYRWVFPTEFDTYALPSAMGFCNKLISKP